MGSINSDERFVRWQTILREQLTFLNNLLIAISVAILGGLVSLLQDNDFEPVHWGKFFFSTGLFLLFISSLIGLLVALIRLHDFRLTVHKIKSEIESAHPSELQTIKDLMKDVGSKTWRFLDWQIYSFILAIFSLLTSFLIIYCDKLF